MSILFLFLKATVYTNSSQDWPVFLVLADLDLLVLLRLIWTIRRWN